MFELAFTGVQDVFQAAGVLSDTPSGPNTVTCRADVFDAIQNDTCTGKLLQSLLSAQGDADLPSIPWRSDWCSAPTFVGLHIAVEAGQTLVRTHEAGAVRASSSCTAGAGCRGSTVVAGAGAQTVPHLQPGCSLHTAAAVRTSLFEAELRFRRAEFVLRNSYAIKKMWKQRPKLKQERDAAKVALQQARDDCLSSQGLTAADVAGARFRYAAPPPSAGVSAPGSLAQAVAALALSAVGEPKRLSSLSSWPASASQVWFRQRFDSSAQAATGMLAAALSAFNEPQLKEAYSRISESVNVRNGGWVCCPLSPLDAGAVAIAAAVERGRARARGRD